MQNGWQNIIPIVFNTCEDYNDPGTNDGNGNDNDNANDNGYYDTFNQDVTAYER